MTRLAQDRFKVVSRKIGLAYQRVWQAVCCECSHVGELIDSSRHRLPPEVLAKKFAVLGWELGAAPNRDRCPSCANRKSEPKETPMTDVKADPPRQPTRADRRRILDALEDHYDPITQRYCQSWSDKGLAAKLNLPLAWVAEERDRAYGPDRNEAAERVGQEARALRAEMEEVQAALIARFDVLDARLKRLEVDSAYQGAA